MEKMKKQRQKETAIVKRAMAELKSLREQVRTTTTPLADGFCCHYSSRLRGLCVVHRRGISRCGCVQITAKDKQIKQSAEKMKKLMAMVAQLKKQHQAEIEKLKLKAA